MFKYKNGGLCFKNWNYEFGLNMEFWGMENMIRNFGEKKEKRCNSYMLKFIYKLLIIVIWKY